MNFDDEQRLSRLAHKADLTSAEQAEMDNLVAQHDSEWMQPRFMPEGGDVLQYTDAFGAFGRGVNH